MTALVVFDISMSLDGYIRGPDPEAEHVLGQGGEHLHAWARDGASEADRRLLSDSLRSAGAVICGRRTYDDSLPGWRADGPTGSARLPVFVVSHSTPAEPVAEGVYRFEHGIASALDAARSAAGGKNVCVMGGADIGQQFLQAGLLDELSLHIAPVFLCGGIRMFEAGTLERRTFRVKSVIHAPCATHIRYQLAGRQSASERPSRD
jgi:dihydrofolate reductase